MLPFSHLAVCQPGVRPSEHAGAGQLGVGGHDSEK